MIKAQFSQWWLILIPYETRLLVVKLFHHYSKSKHCFSRTVNDTCIFFKTLPLWSLRLLIYPLQPSTCNASVRSKSTSFWLRFMSFKPQPISWYLTLFRTINRWQCKLQKKFKVNHCESTPLIPQHESEGIRIKFSRIILLCSGSRTSVDNDLSKSQDMRLVLFGWRNINHGCFRFRTSQLCSYIQRCFFFFSKCDPSTDIWFV